MTLEEHLLIAKCAGEFAKSLIPKGSSNKPNSNVSLNEILSLKSKLRTFFRINKSLTGYERLKKNVEIISKAKVGNCYEHTLIAYFYVISNYNVKACMIDFGNIDHCFLLIAANESNDFKKWGDNAVVCDPWDNVYYPAKYAPVFLSSSFNVFFGYTIKNIYKITDNSIPLIPKKNINKQYLEEFQGKIELLKTYDLVNENELYPIRKAITVAAPIILTLIICNALKSKNEISIGFYISFICFGIFYVNTLTNLYKYESNFNNQKNIFKLNN